MAEGYTGVVLKSKITTAVAEQYLVDEDSGEYRLVATAEGFLEWIGDKWVPRKHLDVRRDLVAWLSGARGRDSEGHEVRTNVTKAYVDDVMEVVESLSRVPWGNQLPSWGAAELRRDPQWDPKFCVAFRDVVYSVKTGMTRERTRDFIDVSTVPVGWDQVKDGECPTFMKCLEEWTCGDRGMAEALQEVYGYALISWRRPARIPLWYGKPRAGKSLNMVVLKHLVGVQACKFGDVYSATSTWGKDGLLEAKVWWIQEIAGFQGAAGARFGSTLKMVAGEDEITTERKYMAPVTGVSRAVVILVSNKMLEVPDHASAVSSKLLVFPFTQSFLGREDFGLEERLLGELGGIAKWALEGARRLVANGGRFTESPKMLAAKEEQAREMNLVRWFLEERFVEDPGGFIPTETVEWQWRKFLADHRIKDHRSMRELAREVVEGTTWHVVRQQASRGAMRKRYGFVGLGLKREYVREEGAV